MSVWFAVPSKRPVHEAELVLKLWREQGYRVALFCDTEDECRERVGLSHFVMCDPSQKYPGYAMAVNRLCYSIMQFDPQAQWIVSGGDDVEPDRAHTAEEIAIECRMHFAACSDSINGFEGTFGVMQPTGDRWGDDSRGRARWPNAPAYIDRVCGSPWLGRQFCARMYQGRGPLFEGYRHMFEDEELQNVAEKLGVLWQRPDLTQYHRHWNRHQTQIEAARNLQATGFSGPAFLKEVSGAKHWEESKAIFEARKAAGFPGHEPVA